MPMVSTWNRFLRIGLSCSSCVFVSFSVGMVQCSYSVRECKSVVMLSVQS
jgi:hypothetical protein